MKFSLKFFVFFAFFFYSGISVAQVSRVYETRNLRVEPVVGYERVQKIEPTPRTTNRFYYGVRANYGPRLLSLEAELTQARDSESFPDDDLHIKETSTTGMLGLRSSFVRGRVVDWYLRAGGHARKVEITQTQNDEVTTREPAVRISPYAGSGFNFRLAEVFSLNAGVTVVFTDRPNSGDREYQTSLGFTISL